MVNNVGAISFLNSKPFAEEHSLSKEVVDILEEYEIYAPENTPLLSNLEFTEMEHLFAKNPGDGAILFNVMAGQVRDSFEAQQKLELKLDAATKYISKIKGLLTDEQKSQI